jgi:hypothetical protein
MAKSRKKVVKGPLHDAAVRIGTTLGKATRAARAAGASGPKAKKEIANLRKSLNSLVRELEVATQRVKKALK